MLNIMKATTATIGLSLALSSLACDPNGQKGFGGFLPENDLNIPVSKSNKGITETEFNAVIDKVEALYAPIVSNMGGTLKVDRKWSDGTVNAYASQSGKVWNVAMFGGLARHETITADGFALVICHEIGHHIGGAPKKGGSGGGWWGGSSGGNSWASNEGQADYFANLKCLRKAFLNDDNAAIVANMNAPQKLLDACKQASRGNAADEAICVRGAMAGKSVANLFSKLSNLPEAKFDTPDSKVVTKTDDNHPKAQCRLDTYFQGSLCEIGMNDDVDQKDEVRGTCHPSLGHKVGLRPLCWFKPKN